MSQALRDVMKTAASRAWGAVVLAGAIGLSAASVFGAPAPAAAERPEVMVYAAASLRDALQSLVPPCEGRAAAHLVFNFGASNELARQIMAANKADVFFSADESWMDKVAEQGLVDATSRRSPLSNRLVVVVPSDSKLAVAGAADLSGAGVGKIALADPEAVPAGKYAKAWLVKAGQWEAVQPKVVPALDVRAALAAVESGAVDAGIVYRTDAALSKKVKVAYEVPEGDGPRVSYAVATLKDRPQHDAAVRAVDCFTGADGTKAFESFGFIVVRRQP